MGAGKAGKKGVRGGAYIPYGELRAQAEAHGLAALGSKKYKNLLQSELSRSFKVVIGNLSGLYRVLYENGPITADVLDVEVTQKDGEDTIVKLEQVQDWVETVFFKGYIHDELMNYMVAWYDINDFIIDNLEIYDAVEQSGARVVSADVLERINAVREQDPNSALIAEFDRLQGDLEGAHEAFMGHLVDKVVRLATLRFNNEQNNKNTIESVQFDVFTKQDILEVSMGEITESVSTSGHDITEQDRIKNTIFNKVIFGSGDKHNNDSARFKNFGHIKLALPVVHPDKYSSTRNYLMTLLGLSEGKTISELINYESFIVLPKDPNWNTAFQGEYTSLMNSKKAARVQIPIFLPTESKYHDADGVQRQAYERKYLSFDVVSYTLFTDGESKKLYPHLSDRGSWKSVLAITGAYAVVYLMAQLDVHGTLSNGNKYLDYRMQALASENKNVPDSVSKVSSFLEALNNRTENGSILDVVTNVVPVIPLAYRDFNKVEEGGVVRIIQPPINIMYNSILQKNIDIREKTHGRQFIAYEVFYALVRESSAIHCQMSYGLMSGEHSGMSKAELTERLKYLNSAIMVELETLNFIGAGVSNTVMNIQADIQKLLYRHIYSAGEVGKTSSILDTLGGKYGDIRDLALAKRVDYTGRTVITPDPKLSLDEIGVPVSILVKWFYDIIVSTVQSAVISQRIRLNLSKGESVKERIKRLVAKIGAAEEQPTVGQGIGHTKLEAHREESQAVEQVVINKLKEILEHHAVLAIRYPSLWRYNNLGQIIVPVFDDTIHTHPLICTAYNADHDGDTFSLWLAQLKETVEEIKELLLPSANFMDTGGNALFKPTQDAILGLYIMTMIDAEDKGPNVDPEAKVQEYINEHLEGEVSAYLEKYGRESISELKKGRLVDKLRGEAIKKLSIKPVLRYYGSYDEMHRDYVLGRIKVSDKVSVAMPHYTKCKFIEQYTKAMALAKKDDRERIQCDPMEFGEIDLNNIRGSIDHMAVVDKTLEQYPQLVQRGSAVVLDEEVPVKKKHIVSTVGMFLFNTTIPQDLGVVKRDPDNEDSLYRNEIDYDYLGQKGILGINNGCIRDILLEVIDVCSRDVSRYVHDNVMRLGFEQATRSGMSLSTGDLITCPEREAIINKYQRQIDNLKESNPEKKKAEVIRLWMECTEQVQKATIRSLPHNNTLYLMSVSGARGNEAQITQILGMRGLLIDPVGNVIDIPVKRAFADGMSAMDNSIASYGAIKGMIDKANKTKDTGSFARTSIFGSSEVRIVSGDCGDKEGAWMYPIPYNYLNVEASTGIGRFPFSDEYECVTPNRTLLVENKLLLDSKGTLRMTENKQIFNVYHWYAYNPHIMRQGELAGAIKMYEHTDDKFQIRMIFFSKEFFLRLEDKKATTHPQIIHINPENGSYVQDKKYTIDMGVAVCTSKVEGAVGHGFVVFENDGKDLDSGVWGGINDIESLIDSPFKLYSEFMQYTDLHKCAYADKEHKTLVAAVGGKMVYETTSGLKVAGTFRPGGLSSDEERLLPKEMQYESTQDRVTVRHNGELVYHLGVADVEGIEYLPQKLKYKNLVFYPNRALALKTDLNSEPNIVYDGAYYHINQQGNTVALSRTGEFYAGMGYKFELTPYKAKATFTEIADERQSTCLIETTNLINKLNGHFTLAPILDKYTGEVLVGANRPMKKKDGVGPAVLGKISQQYPEGVFIRSVSSCKSPNGKCAKCYGYNHGFHRYARVGDFVSASASHAMSEFLSQSTMRTFHTGGAAIGGDVADTFAAVSGLLLHGQISDVYIKSLLTESNKVSTFEIHCVREQVRKLPEFYTHSSPTEPVFTGVGQEYPGAEGGHEYEVTLRVQQPNPDADNDAFAPKFNAVVEQYKRTHSDYGVVSGMVPVTLENYGLARLGEYREVYNYMLDKLDFIFKHSGKMIMSADLEIMAACIVQFMFVVSKGDSEHHVASEVHLKNLFKDNILLALNKKVPFVAAPTNTNIPNSASNSKNDALLALGFQNAKKVLGDATLNARKVDTINPIVSTFTGTKMETGSNLRPEKYTNIVKPPREHKDKNARTVRFVKQIVEQMVQEQKTKHAEMNAAMFEPVPSFEAPFVDATQFGAPVQDIPVEQLLYHTEGTVEEAPVDELPIVDAVAFGQPPSVGADDDEYTPDDEDEGMEQDEYKGVDMDEVPEYGSDEADMADIEAVSFGEYGLDNDMAVTAVEDADEDLGVEVN